MAQPTINVKIAARLPRLPIDRIRLQGHDPTSFNKFSMLYKFKSKTTGDVIMLQPNGRRVLDIIGKDTTPGTGDKGIILPGQMAAAIAALEAAITKEEAERKAAIEKALTENQSPPQFDGVSLHQRTLPFIEMLRRCEKANTEVVWGV